jgi:hypothetical protein
MIGLDRLSGAHSMTRAKLLALFSASVVAWQAAAPARPAESALLAPLLPQGEGQSACYTGAFTGQAMDIEDWSRARSEPTENLSPDGKPYMRHVPPVMKATPIRSFTLQLTYDSRTSDYDWIYNFRLLADAEGIGTMYAAGECPWYAKDKVYGWDKREITGSTTGMLCYIDCDGGFFDVDRIAGAPALTLSFDAVHGLKMKGGCGGGGIYRVKAPSSSGIAFRLQTASAEVCKPLEELAKR